MAVLTITAANKQAARDRAIYVGAEKEVSIVLPALGATSDVEWVDPADTGLSFVTKAWATPILPTAGAVSPVVLACIPNRQGQQAQPAQNGACGIKSSAATSADGVLLVVRGKPR